MVKEGKRGTAFVAIAGIYPFHYAGREGIGWKYRSLIQERDKEIPRRLKKSFHIHFSKQK